MLVDAPGLSVFPININQAQVVVGTIDPSILFTVYKYFQIVIYGGVEELLERYRSGNRTGSSIKYIQNTVLMNNPVFILALSCDRGNLVGAQASFPLPFLGQINRPLFRGIINGNTLERVNKPISPTILVEHFDLLTFQMILLGKFPYVSLEVFRVR